jgi:hypothetical protein|tara:strand:+ start:403 stop:606 length:204 start_codon:yes stop_codon:yes gene_type:complete
VKIHAVSAFPADHDALKHRCATPGRSPPASAEVADIVGEPLDVAHICLPADIASIGYADEPAQVVTP